MYEENYYPTWFTGNCIQGAEIERIFDAYKQQYGALNVYRTINVGTNNADTLLGTYYMCRWYGRDAVRYYKISGGSNDDGNGNGNGTTFQFSWMWLLVIAAAAFFIFKGKK